jgi:hypothetical protein
LQRKRNYLSFFPFRLTFHGSALSFSVFLPQVTCPVLKKLRFSVLCPVLNIADPFQGCPVFGRCGVVNLLEAANEGPAIQWQCHGPDA